MEARIASLTWYGAYELKRSYQKHLGYGTAFSALFALCVTGGILTYQALTAKTIVKDPIITIYEPPKPIPPPRTNDRPIIPRIATEVPLPVIGIPTPVPDEEVQSEVRFPTRDELAAITPNGSETHGMDGNAGIAEIPNEDLGDYFPSPNEFVAVQEMPTLIKTFEPEYPEVALLTNREATVWIKALVDKGGKVREARIAKSSGMNVGFDEAALAAAYKNIYKPAIQNGQPVAIWVTYPVEFKMK